MHPTESALLAAVLDHPTDDMPRLILADWLEEHGRVVEAHGQRWQAANNKRPHQITGEYPFMWTSEGGLPEALPHAGLPRDVCRAMGFQEWQCYSTLAIAERSLADVLWLMRHHHDVSTCLPPRWRA